LTLQKIEVGKVVFPVPSGDRAANSPANDYAKRVHHGGQHTPAARWLQAPSGIRHFAMLLAHPHRKAEGTIPGVADFPS
jgi:hypothetical protein